MRRVLGVLLLTLPACAETPCYVATAPRVAYVAVPAPMPPPPSAPPPPAPPDSSAEVRSAALVASQVLVMESPHINRPTEVVGVVDVHAEMGHQEVALAALRAQAAGMGADAVLGVEFHHGHDEGEPTHLSGMAVRFIQLGP